MHHFTGLFTARRVWEQSAERSAENAVQGAWTEKKEERPPDSTRPPAYGRPFVMIRLYGACVDTEVHAVSKGKGRKRDANLANLPSKWVEGAGRGWNQQNGSSIT